MNKRTHNYKFKLQKSLTSRSVRSRGSVAQNDIAVSAWVRPRRLQSCRGQMRRADVRAGWVQEDELVSLAAVLAHENEVTGERRCVVRAAPRRTEGILVLKV